MKHSIKTWQTKYDSNLLKKTGSEEYPSDKIIEDNINIKEEFFDSMIEAKERFEEIRNNHEIYMEIQNSYILLEHILLSDENGKPILEEHGKYVK